MRTVSLSFRACEIAIFASAILSLLVRTTDSRKSRHCYAIFAPDLEVLEQFEHQIAMNLTQALLGSTLLPIGSEIRYLTHTYLIDFYQSAGLSQIQDVIDKKQTGASTNPICAYRMIRRTLRLGKHLFTHSLYLSKLAPLRSEIIYFFWRKGWPIFEDNQIATEKVLTLQHVYNLEADNLARGSIMKVQTNCSLSSVHCYEIGNVALKSEQFTLALEWLELAKRKVVDDKMASAAFIELSIWSAIDEHNWNYFKKREALPLTLFSRPIRYIPGDSQRARKVRDIQYNKLKGKRGRSLDVQDVNFWGLCSGENFQTGKEKAVLFCWMEFKMHASLTIGPLKMEFLARNPDVVQAYEVVKETDLKNILAESKKRIFESGLQMTERNCSIRKIHSRRSKTFVRACYEGEAGNNMSGILRQLGSSEDISCEMQIDSYSFGGHYLPHQDQMPIKNRQSGIDVVGSAVLHINHVEEGGKIAFPSLGVAAKPMRGSIVFWHNIYRDGSSDRSTSTGSCPVVIGQKWALTRWIRLKDQFFRQNCGLNPKERFRIPVNGEYLPVPKIVFETAEEILLLKYPFGNPAILSKYSFVSPRGLKAFVQFEWSLYPIIKRLYDQYRNQTQGTCREKFEKKINNVKKYLEEFEEFNLKLFGGLDHISNGDIRMVERVALNLMSAYRTVTRFMNFIQTWFRRKQYTDNVVMSRITSYLDKVYKITDGPTQADLEAAMFGIWHIQFTQNLEIKDVVNGIVAGENTRVSLNARDCLNFAKHSGSFSLATPSLMWAEHAFNLVNNSSDDSVTYEEAFDAVATRQLDYECKFRPKQPICPIYARFKYSRNKLQTHFSDVKFATMCKGKNFQSDTEKSKLFCWYEREIHPSYKIAPIKAEWLSLPPKTEIVRYYDVISNRLVDSLTNFANENAFRDGELDVNGRLVVKPTIRQIMFAFADPANNTECLYVSKLAERMTGLKIVNNTGGPGIRLTGYSPGSHRGLHLDARSQTATFIIYFTDVGKGGETPFIAAGVSAVPRKGSAIFWYNTFTDGSLNYATEHGGCPIISGEKWVALRWIAYAGQDHLKCDLKPKTQYKILVNGKPMY